jgi:hypothetical protein
MKTKRHTSLKQFVNDIFEWEKLKPFLITLSLELATLTLVLFISASNFDYTEIEAIILYAMARLVFFKIDWNEVISKRLKGRN